MTARNPIYNDATNTKLVDMSSSAGDTINPALLPPSTPGGLTGQIQYNHSGVFGGFDTNGDATINVVTGALTIANNAVTTVKLNNTAVTLAKIQNATANSKLLGSGSTGSGASYSEITLGTGLSISGTTVNVTNGGVNSFNTRTGAITLTSSDVTTALTYTPANAAGQAFTGNITVTTSSGSALCDVKAPSATTAGFRIASNGGTFGTTSFDIIQSPTDNSATLFNASNAQIKFGINAAFRFWIGTDGKFGFGLDPTVAGSATAILKMLHPSSSSDVWAFGPQSDGNFVATIQSSNSGVFISKSTPTVGWVSTSDERAKVLLGEIENPLQKISTLRSQLAYYKNDLVQTRIPVLIAQDVLAVLPEAVYQPKDQDEFLGLAYSAIIPLLVAALKETLSRIETLEAKLV